MEAPEGTAAVTVMPPSVVRSTLGLKLETSKKRAANLCLKQKKVCLAVYKKADTSTWSHPLIEPCVLKVPPRWGCHGSPGSRGPSTPTGSFGALARDGKGGESRTGAVATHCVLA